MFNTKYRLRGDTEGSFRVERKRLFRRSRVDVMVGPGGEYAPNNFSEESSAREFMKQLIVEEQPPAEYKVFTVIEYDENNPKNKKLKSSVLNGDT